MQFLLKFTEYGILFALVLCLQKLLSRHRNQNTWLAFFLFLSVASILNGVIATGTRTALEYDWLTFLYVPSLLAVGPLYYMYYLMLLNPKVVDKRRLLFHFFPGMAGVVIDILVRVTGIYARYDVIGQLFKDPLDHLLTPLIIVSCLHMLFYFIMLLVVTLKLHNRQKAIRLFARIGVVTNINAIVGMVFLLSGFLLSNTLLYYTGAALISLIMLEVLVLSVRYPGFFQVIARELKDNRKAYEKYLLGKLDINRTVSRLQQVMEAGELYLDDNLSANQVAREAGLTPGQLSQLLNNELKIDFRNYVNRYRIEYAKKLLKEDPGANILGVCYQSGFNSKSAFNEAFKKFTGSTPSMYRAGK